MTKLNRGKSESTPRADERVPCRDCGRPTVTYAVLRRHKGDYALCAACSLKTMEDE